MDTNDWMQGLDNSLEISQVNLPGSHDSASINESWLPSGPYTTQLLSIPNQLKYGIRLLDVRLKVKVEEGGNSYEFMTCHGDTLPSVQMKKYQTFDTLMEKCVDFLNDNTTEFIIMLLRIDDWNGEEDSYQQVLNALAEAISTYGGGKIYSGIDIPRVEQVRNKIFLLNNIPEGVENVNIGRYIPWDENCDGKEITVDNELHYYLQDKYKDLALDFSSAEKQKTDIYISAIKKFKQLQTSNQNLSFLINFASATHLGVGRKPKINQKVLDEFLKYTPEQRPNEIGQFGWTFFDYTDMALDNKTIGDGTASKNPITITEFIAASNFEYIEL